MTGQHDSKAMAELAEGYFAAVDDFDVDRIMSHFADDCVLEVPTHNVSLKGLDAVRQSYIGRASIVTKSWHGDFEFFPANDGRRLAVRLKVKRTTTSGENQEMDNVTILKFAGGKIERVSIWMAGENSLK